MFAGGDGTPVPDDVVEAQRVDEEQLAAATATANSDETMRQLTTVACSLVGGAPLAAAPVATSLEFLDFPIMILN
jgi:hypothetical protein